MEKIRHHVPENAHQVGLETLAATCGYNVRTINQYLKRMHSSVRVNRHDMDIFQEEDDMKLSRRRHH